jgi:periplasmic protein TonB
MTGVRKLQGGELIALHEHGRAGLALRAPDAPLAADWHNVIPFQRRGADAQAPEVALPSDATRLPAKSLTRDRLRLFAFAALSLVLHGGLLAAAWREPVPLVSIGTEAMSIEIVVGATAPAGVAQAPGENEVQAADRQAAEPQREAEQKATEQPQTVQVAPDEKTPEQTAQPETAQAEPRPAIAMVEAPKPEEPTAKPKEAPPDTTEVSLLPQPEDRPAEPKPDAKPLEVQAPKPVQNAVPAKERRRIEAPTKDHAAKQAKASAPSAAANNVGVGRSDSNSNYAGLVSAHLRRHQQYPTDARSGGQQGTATVSFSLDGGGRVTSARLARASGVASLDQEVQAMVRRASPFPAPPSRQGVSFTVPVTFRLN